MFLLRDAMRMRGLCCRPVSVRPSLCHVGVLYAVKWIALTHTVRHFIVVNFNVNVNIYIAQIHL